MPISNSLLHTASELLIFREAFKSILSKNLSVRYRCANNTTFHTYHLHSNPNNALVRPHSTEAAELL